MTHDILTKTITLTGEELVKAYNVYKATPSDLRKTYAPDKVWNWMVQYDPAFVTLMIENGVTSEKVSQVFIDRYNEDEYAFCFATGATDDETIEDPPKPTMTQDGDDDARQLGPRPFQKRRSYFYQLTLIDSVFIRKLIEPQVDGVNKSIQFAQLGEWCHDDDGPGYFEQPSFCVAGAAGVLRNVK